MTFFWDWKENGKAMGNHLSSYQSASRSLQVLISKSTTFSNTYIFKAKNPSQKTKIIDRICDSRWPPSSVVHLATTFRDITMTLPEMQSVVKKIVKEMKAIDLQELPPLVYQMLLLSTKVC